MKKLTLNITAGTDVVLNDNLTFQGEVFDPSLSVNVEANLISGLGKRSALSFEFEDTHMIIDVPWEEGRLTGCYGLEVRGVTNGRKWATYSDSLIRYTKATEDGASSVTDEGDVYDITQTVAYRYSVSPIEEITADTDGMTGTPSVSVDYDGKDIAFHFDGIKGEKGDAFTYDDFTPEELERLRGPQGPKGNDGVVLDPDAVTIFDSIDDLEGREETEKAKMIPSGILISDTINGKSGIISPIMTKNKTKVFYAGGGSAGYWQGGSSATGMIFDLSNFQGKTIEMTFSYASNAFKWLIVSDYTQIPTSADTADNLASILLASGGKGYPEGNVSNLKLIVPSQVSFLVLSALVATYGEPTVYIKEASSSGIIGDIYELRSQVKTLDAKTLTLDGINALVYTQQTKFLNSVSAPKYNYASSSNYKVCVYDVTSYVGKIIQLLYTKRVNTKQYVLVKDYTLITTTSTDQTENLLGVGGNNGDASDVTVPSTTTINLASQAIVNHVAGGGSVYAMVSLYINTDPSELYAEEPLDMRVGLLSDAITGVDDNIRKDMREAYIGMKYVAFDSINDVFLKYSSQRDTVISGARAGLKSVCTIGFGPQSAALYGRHLFIFSQESRYAAVVDVETMTIITKGYLIADSAAHHNCAAFIAEKYDDNDPFPLLMVGGVTDEINVYRVLSPIEGTYDIVQVCTITVPSEELESTAGNYHFWDGKLLYQYRSSKSGVNSIWMATFVMPTIGTQQSIQLNTSDLLDDWNAYPSMTMQDSFIDGDVMYIGLAYGIAYYDLANKEYVASVDFANKSNRIECESNFVYNGIHYIVCQKGTSESGIYILDVRTE